MVRWTFEQQQFGKAGVEGVNPWCYSYEVAEKEDDGQLSNRDNEDQTKQRRWPLPLSILSQMPRSEDQPQTDKESSSHASLKPSSRPTTRTEVKSPPTRDSSLSPDTRPQLQRRSVGEKTNSTTERTSTTGRNVPVPSSVNAGQHQPRKRTAVRKSKEAPAAPSAVSRPSLKQNQANEEVKRHAKTSASDVSAGPASVQAVSSRRSCQHDGDRSTPPVRNSWLIADDRDNYPSRAVTTSDPDDVDSTDDETVRATGRERCERYPQETRWSHSTDADTASLSRRVRDRDHERYKHDLGVLQPGAVELKERLESLPRRPSDLDLRRRADRECYVYPQGARVSRSTDVDSITNNTESLSPRRVSDKDLERYKRQLRMQQLADAEEDGSVESLSDLDVRRKDEYLQTLARPQRDNALPQRASDTSPAKDTRRDATGRREQTSPVRTRRRPTSESAINKSKREARDDATRSSSPASAGRGETSARPASPRPILRKTSPHQAGKDPTTIDRRKVTAKPRQPSAPPAPHRPASARPLRRTPAAAVVAADDDDADSFASHVGRGLAKRAAVTDLSDDKLAGVSHAIAPNKRYRENLRMLSSATPIASVRSTSTSLTPRRIWQFMRPLLIRLTDCTRQMLQELSRSPQVVATGRKVRKAGLQVMDDWSLFAVVIFVFACIFLVIMLS